MNKKKSQLLIGKHVHVLCDIIFFHVGTVEIFFVGDAQKISAQFLNKTWWHQKECVIAASLICRGCPNTCEHPMGSLMNDPWPMQLQTRASKTIGLLLKVCINDVWKIYMSNICFLILNDFMGYIMPIMRV